MQKLFEKVLCPVDFDTNSIAAVEFARNHAEKENGKIWLLHVVATTLQPIAMDPYPPLIEEANAQLQRIARERLEAKVPFEVVVGVGDPADTIVRKAAELGASVIVMATHGRKALARFILGSVAERVVREANQPVLSIQPESSSFARYLSAVLI